MLLNIILPFLSGGLYAFGFPRKELPHSILFAHIGVFILFYILLKKQTNLKQRLITLLVYCIGHNLVGYYWIPETLKAFGEIPFPINYLLGMIFSLIVLPQYFILLFLLASEKVKQYVTFTPLILTFTLTLLEFFTPQQFPGHLGHTWMQLAPYLSFAKVFGVPIYSFISYLFIFNLIEVTRRKKVSASMVINSAVIFVLLIINFLNPLKMEVKKTLPIRLVQANIGNLLKIESESGLFNADQVVFKRYEKHSLKENDLIMPRLIIWPETAYSKLLNTNRIESGQNKVPPNLASIALKKNAYLFTGGYDRANEGRGGFYQTQYNSALFFSPAAKFIDVYHKRKLIPFGESLPFGPLNSYLVNLNPNIAFFAEGTTYPIFSIDNEFHFSSAICYEILFSSFIRDYLNNASIHPDFIINITNDSWYGDTAEPFQHKFLAHWRSIEFQLPLVRMTNTGISNILYQDGSESKALYHNQEDALDLNLKVSKSLPTLYQRYGILLMILFGFLIIGLERLLKPFLHKIMKPKES